MTKKKQQQQKNIQVLGIILVIWARNLPPRAVFFLGFLSEDSAYDYDMY